MYIHINIETGNTYMGAHRPDQNVTGGGGSSTTELLLPTHVTHKRMHGMIVNAHVFICLYHARKGWPICSPDREVPRSSNSAVPERRPK